MSTGILELITECEEGMIDCEKGTVRSEEDDNKQSGKGKEEGGEEEETEEEETEDEERSLKTGVEDAEKASEGKNLFSLLNSRAIFRERVSTSLMDRILSDTI